MDYKLISIYIVAFFAPWLLIPYLILLIILGYIEKCLFSTPSAKVKKT